MLKNGMPSRGISVEDARKKDIDFKFDNVKQMNDDVDKEIITKKGELRDFKIGLLEKIYSEMRALGVDPGNVEEVGKFLEKLEQTDPDLVILFESAINALDPMKEGPEQPASPPAGAEEATMPPGIMPPEGMQPGGAVMPSGVPPEGVVPGVPPAGMPQEGAPVQPGGAPQDLMGGATTNLQDKIMR